jgi:hypothetical protein
MLGVARRLFGQHEHRIGHIELSHRSPSSLAASPRRRIRLRPPLSRINWMLLTD